MTGLFIQHYDHYCSQEQMPDFCCHMRQDILNGKLISQQD